MASSNSVRWSIADERGWSIVADEIANQLAPGAILTLQGPLGAGKTTFVQALAAALGSKKVPKSPTFSMLRTYAVHHGDVRRLLHVDAYRIDDEADLIALDLDAELSDGDAILVLEWPEQIPGWLKKRPHFALKISLKEPGRTAELQRI
jgi:tRNA threonylcarbamoyladenosine biosynthesis protein TsaE